VTDDEDRENEGDLIMAGCQATAERLGFVVRYSSGVVCMSVRQSRLDALRLPPMCEHNEDPKQTAYSVSCDAATGISTGISAADRACAFRVLADPESVPTDLQRPGHVFPLRYTEGGVAVRAGHTEASFDLVALSGLPEGGILAELVNDDGTVMRMDDIKVFAETHGLVLTSVQDIAAYRQEEGIHRL
jgi:3,4-dihydroxy-2-butanone 4-phosphate synthase